MKAAEQLLSCSAPTARDPMQCRVRPQFRLSLISAQISRGVCSLTFMGRAREEVDNAELLPVVIEPKQHN